VEGKRKPVAAGSSGGRFALGLLCSGDDCGCEALGVGGLRSGAAECADGGVLRGSTDGGEGVEGMGAPVERVKQLQRLEEALQPI
jgi:hypothetical protein